MEQNPQDFWRKCSSCKKPIALGASYYVCSVSTCNGQRTGYVFCRMQCFESHLPGARHRDAGAIEKKAPMQPETGAADAARAPARIIVKGASSSAASPASASAEVLVIASRLKDYIHARSEMSTSAAVMDVLSEHLRRMCERAIDNARAEGRKTVMDRDFEFLPRLK